MAGFTACSEKEEVGPEPSAGNQLSANQKNGTDIGYEEDGGGIDENDPRPIRGIAVNSGGSGLFNVNVALHDEHDTFLKDTYSDPSGDYQIDSVYPETYKLHFNLEGYQELIRTIEVSGTDPLFEVGIDTLMAD